MSAFYIVSENEMLQAIAAYVVSKLGAGPHECKVELEAVKDRDSGEAVFSAKVSLLRPLKESSDEPSRTD